MIGYIRKTFGTAPLKPRHDPSDQLICGDWPAIPAELKTVFHDGPVTGGAQHGRS